MTTFEVTRDEVVFAVGDPVSFDVVPVVTAFTVQPGPGADGTSFTARGPWDSGDTYAVGDVVSFDGGNYILYASPPTGGDPDVDTSHWDVFGSSSVPDGTTSVKGIVQLEDSHTSTSTTKAATPKNVKEAYDLAAAAQPADSDLTAIAGATLTGDGYLKRASSVWSLDTPSGGGGGLPDPTGNEGAVLGTDGTDAAWVRSIVSADGATDATADNGGAGLYATDGVESSMVRAKIDGTVEINATGAVTAYYESGAVYNAVVADAMGSGVFATDGTESAVVCANVDGTVEITATGAVTVAPGDGFRVVGDVGATVLNGDDYLMETASDTGVQAPGATYSRSRGSLGSEAAVENGDTLAVPLYAQAHDGTGLVLAATITAEVDGTVATGKVPTRVRIATADADGVLTDRMVIGADGTTDVLGDFTVNGAPVSGGGGGGGGDTEGAIDTIDDVDTGGALTDDGTYYYLTFDTPGIFPLDVSLTTGDYASVDAFAWGAAGGGTSFNTSGWGGPGGHARATCTVRTGRHLVVIGSGGLSRAASAGPGARGFGGGGLTGNIGFAGQGGGYTGLFRRVLDLASALIIAGGGGGAGGSGQHGGPGGGEDGGDGGGNSGSGAKQHAPGSGATSRHTEPPGPLLGAASLFTDDTGGAGGGGGGKYGGDSGTSDGDTAGGGGSGYVDPDDTSGATLEAGSGTGSGATPGGDDHALYPGSPVGVGGNNTTDGGPGYLVLRWPM